MNARPPGTVLSRHLQEILLVAIAAAAFVVVWPVGEYLILDDWAFAKSLQYLHEQGKLVVLQWNPMSLTGHLIWGLLFTKTLGFSFLTMKLAAFSAGLLLTLIVYRLIVFTGAHRWLAFLAACSLFLNPLFLVHVFMYMTDVTGLLWQWLSILCIFAGLRMTDRRQQGILAAGSAFWALGFLTRQHGILLPVALAIHIVMFDRRCLRPSIVVPAFGPGICLSGLGLAWHAAYQQQNASFQISSALITSFLRSPPWESLPYILWTYAIYAGLFAAPVVLSVKPRRRLAPVPLLLFFAGAWFGVLYWTHASMNGWYFPYCRNVITPFGLFQPNEFVIGWRRSLWDPEWGIGVGLLGLAGVLLWIFHLASWLSVKTNAAAAISQGTRPADVVAQELNLPRGIAPEMRFAVQFLGILMVCQLAYIIATTPILYDRHLLLVAPTAIVLGALIADRSMRIHGVAAAVILSGYAAYGAVCSHDLHAVSRAVFLEGVRLVDAGIAPEHIDAGYAFDGWYMYEKSQAKSPAPAVSLPPWWPNRFQNPEMDYPWWVYGLATQVRPDYVVSTSPGIPTSMFQAKYRFEEIACDAEFVTYWPPETHKLHLFRGYPVVEAAADGTSVVGRDAEESE